jgi:hypothetical protein
MATAQIPTNPSDLFKQAVEACQTALRTGAQVQEEATRRFTELLCDVGSPLNWQKNAQSMVNEAIIAAQKNVDASIGVINQNARTAMTMMQRAFEARPADGAAQETADSTVDSFWESALTALRTNTQLVFEANSRLLESWAQLVQITNRVEQGARDASSRAQNGAEEAMKPAKDATGKAQEAAQAT